MSPAGVRSAELPVRAFAEHIVTAVRDNPFTIIIGETGSGKTTQISQASRPSRGAACILARPCPGPPALCSRCAAGHVPAAVRGTNSAARGSHGWECSCTQILDEAGFSRGGQICVTQPRRVVRGGAIACRGAGCCGTPMRGTPCSTPLYLLDCSSCPRYKLQRLPATLRSLRRQNASRRDAPQPAPSSAGCRDGGAPGGGGDGLRGGTRRRLRSALRGAHLRVHPHQVPHRWDPHPYRAPACQPGAALRPPWINVRLEPCCRAMPLEHSFFSRSAHA